MSCSLPPSILECFRLADPSWHACLHAGFDAMMQADPQYLHGVVQTAYLPNNGRLLAAFAQPMDAVRYVLVGESPYPRSESATGVCFMDGAVQELWSEKGLSKRVNRATSLRNFMKMLLVADGQLNETQTTGEPLATVSQKAQANGSKMIQTLSDLQENMHRAGFLLLNAALVFRQEVPPAKESRAWEPFLRVVFQSLLDHANNTGREVPMLVLWGKIAERLSTIDEAQRLPQVRAEHPYNLSFIANPVMHQFFVSMRLLNKAM